MTQTNSNSTDQRSSIQDGHSYTLQDGTVASETVYTAVAELTDRSPLELEPLAYSIDPDALDEFAAGADDDRHWYVSFDYDGYRITVTTDEVVLKGRDSH